MNKRIIEGRTLLFVDDDEEFVRRTAQYFSATNKVFTSGTLNHAKEIIEKERLDAIILDIILPDGEGLKLLQEMKGLPPVVILSSLSGDDDVLEGLFSGAVDYVVKPCSPQVLEARLSLRLLPKEEAILSLNGLETDLNNRTVKYNGAPVQLTGSEFNILYLLMSHAGKFFTSEKIYEEIWKAPSLQTTTVKRHISTLRNKLKEATKRNLIITEFGKGYCMLEEQQ